MSHWSSPSTTRISPDCSTSAHTCRATAWRAGRGSRARQASPHLARDDRPPPEGSKRAPQSCSAPTPCIVGEATRLLGDAGAYGVMARAHNLLVDGAGRRSVGCEMS